MSARTQSAPTATTIVIRNLDVRTHIGVHDFEHDKPQAVRFDIEIETVPDYLEQVAQSDCYVSYADVVAYIEAKASSGEHVRLVEEWAQSIADFVLENPLVEKVSVVVLKTEIFEQAEGVGVRLVRGRG